MASEREIGQTKSSNTFGVRTVKYTDKFKRNVWKSIPEKVKVLYLKSELG